jgi:phosphonoacetate hydrolase
VIKARYFQVSSAFQTLVVALLLLALPSRAQTSQRTIVVMLDGFGEDYYRQSDMPNLRAMATQGVFKVVPSLMPAVTNVNNIAIATGELPDKNGITGNVFLNPQTGKEEYIEDPALITSPSMFDRARQRGIKSALFSVKKKTVDLLGRSADVSLCPECDGAAQTVWSQQVGPPPGVYTKEVSYWLMEAALYTLKHSPEYGLVYIHTTDYPMHTWAPEEADSKDFLHRLDAYLGQLRATAPDAAILITADHGLNHKDLAWDLEKACAQRHTPIRVAISPEKDRYVKHHRGLGGSAYVYLNAPQDLEKVRQTLRALPGVDAVLTRAEAVRQYHLMADRIGDLMVLGNKTTVFGQLDAESEKLPTTYRSHGSAYECRVPLFVYNAKQAPAAAFFDFNYKVAAWLYR